MPAADNQLEQLEPWLAELEAQNCLLEKQRAETEKELMKEKRGKERTAFYADSFAFKQMSALVGLEKEVRTLKCDLATCEEANTDLQKGQEAAEVREDATEGKIRLVRQTREGMVRKQPIFPLE